MTFETPSALWLALALPLILLLWILRPRRPRLRVPSLLLWPVSPAERQAARPWQRLRHHPLLWLQLAAAALLALAAARPFLPASAAAQHVVVLLDASGSMRAADVAPDRFGAARATVLDLARSLGPGQELSVVRVDSAPRVLVASAASPGQVEAALAGETADYGPPDVAGAVALAAGIRPGPAEWVLVTDGGVDLAGTAGSGAGAPRLPPGTAFRVITIGRSDANVAVTALAARARSAGEPGADALTLQAGLRNTGGAPVAGRLQLLAEGALIGAQEWRLDAGAEGYVTWSGLPRGPRWYEVRLAGVPAAANALALDDRAWAAVPGGEAADVLLVTAGNPFLERALAIDGRLRLFRVAPEDGAGVGGAYPLTVLDRAWPGYPETRSLPPGNTLLIGPPGGEEFRPRAMWPRPDHPLLQHVDWSEVRVGLARRLDLGPEWETVIDSDGGPLLTVRQVPGEAGRQAVLAFDLAASDLPLRPAFPILMANLLEWLLPRPDAAPRTVPPGGALPVDAAPLARSVRVEAVAGAAAETAGSSEPGAPSSAVDLAPPWPPRPFRPAEPGLYRVVQRLGDEATGSAGGPPPPETGGWLIADGYSAAEAAIAPRAPGLPAAEGGNAPDVQGALAFWPWLAAAVLGLATLEWWVDARGR